MSFIKHHWFGLLIAIFIAFFACFLLLIILAPKQDLKGRGFIPCIQTMTEDLLACERQLFCSVKAVLKNTGCNIAVIGQGFKDWTAGIQPKPWSNYIFEPELSSSYVDEEFRQEYLKNHPDVKAEMERLHILRKDLENEQDISEISAPWDNIVPARMGSE